LTDDRSDGFSSVYDRIERLKLKPKHLDRAVLAALANRPTAEEREHARNLIAFLDEVARQDPVRLAAAASAAVTFEPDPARPDEVGDDAVAALDADYERWEGLWLAREWLSAFTRAFTRFQDATGDLAIAAHPNETAVRLPAWDPLPDHAAERDLVTPTHAAARLGVDLRTLQGWTKSGDLPAIRLPNGRRRYTDAALKVFAERTGR
jgi:hypothetical protein